MRIAVTGAFSYTGKYIARKLLERGDEVVTLTNHPDRPDPFAGRVKAYPLDFGREARLVEALTGADVLVNTYWVRFDRGAVTQAGAVENTRALVRAAKAAGVGRIVHISITNPSADSHLPYFSGKAANERAVVDSGLGYSILRPTLIFGTEDILINNIAWILRRFPLFAQIGDGRYKLQPVCVDDLAEVAGQAVHGRENATLDVTGPETFTFDELVHLIGRTVGWDRPILHVPAGLALQAARFISLFIGDVLITKEEVGGLMAGLLVSPEPPRGSTRLSDWLEANRDTVGRQYASELARHYQ
ncbi:MAG TPA: NAD(P)H-binding protein [Anaerolineales bacterium]|nr:NAD(P)H-binding protein [Anaerolineales bacterium]